MCVSVVSCHGYGRRWVDVSTRRDVGMLVSARTLNVLVYGCRHEATSSLVFIYILVLSNCIIVLYNGILALLN